LERARQVEPLEPLWASELGDLHLDFRHHAEAEKIADAMIAKLPAESSTPFWNLKRELALARGDTAAAALANEKSGLLKRGGINIYHRMALVALLQHRYAEAARLLGSIPEKARTRANVPASRVNPFAAGYYNVWLGIALRAQGDKEKAEAAFATAEQGFREWLRRYPEEPSALGWLTVCVAGQGRRDDTLREIAKAIETFPLSRNPIRAVEIRDEVANAYAWTGDRVLALDLLQEIVHLPGGPTAGDLKLDPRWDDLREDPRFEKLIAEAAKPIAL
jgi:tetratricopeptide (TPR) repeat protein